MANNSTARLDVGEVRAQFPILQREINGYPLVYLDSAASAQKPRRVIEAVSATYANSYANVHRGLHTLANEATEAMEQARLAAAKFLGAGSGREVIFTKGGTEAINLVASSFVEPAITAGDEIVLSVMEHHSNIVPWHFLRERKGAVLRWINIDDDGALDLAQLAAAMNSRTRFVAITHMSNVLGTVNPLAEIISIAHAAGAKVLVDGCQGAVHQPVDVAAMDVDFYVCTGHKLYGPSGIGLLYGKREHLQAMRPYQGGGEMIDSVCEQAVTYADAPYRFEAGTPPIVETIGLGTAIDWLGGLGRAAVAAHEQELLEHVTTELEKAGRIRVFGKSAGKGAIASFMVEGIHAHDVAALLDQYGIAVRAGAHCTEPLMQRLGVTSICRASFGVYNTHEDVERLLAGLDKVSRFF